MKNEDDDRMSTTSNISMMKSKDRMKPLSNFSIMKNKGSSQSIRSHNRSFVSNSSRRLPHDIGGGRRMQRRLSRIQENFSVIVTCERNPNVCVLCASGIPSTKCIACGAPGHNRCIEAFFCTVDKKVDWASWQCPKCVTLNNLKLEDKTENPLPMINQLEPKVKPAELDCPFCRIEMNIKSCQCDECLTGKEGTSKFKKCTCEKPQKQQFSRCLHCRESGAVCTYKSLRADEIEKDEEEDSGNECIWSMLWCILLVTVAFPIAMVSAYIYIFIFCFESCFDVSYYVSIFLLKGINLPGTCCRGIRTGCAIC